MTFQIADFSSQVALNAMIHHAYANRAAELNAIATALGSDPTTHDTTIQTPPAGLRPGDPANSHFTNDILAVVNAGKGGNLTNAAMAAAITAGLANEIPPVNTVAPVVSGTGTVGQVLTTTNGTWQYSPTSYAYRWMRGATPINLNGTSQTYTLVAADSGTNVSCQVAAANAAGFSPTAASNAIAVT
jgi:hypothetical protein